MYIKLIVKILSLFDFFQKRKLIKFLKNERMLTLENFIDVGGHYGETIFLFNKNFNIKNIYSFEASPINFKILNKKIEKLNHNKIKIYNIALGQHIDELEFNQSSESQSSTFLKINTRSKYLARKKKYLFLKDNEYFLKTFKVKIITLQSFIKNNLINKIDFLKIDTEGFDFDVIKGLGSDIKKVKYLYSEHHFHDMFKKNYKFSDINDHLKKNNFKKIFKIKMMFRKTFEYIYCNETYSD